ncbi:peptidase, partial [Clostridium perfringens]
GYTGEDTARKILDSNGLYNVRIEMVRGRLSDHYDPRSKVLRLSQDVYSGTSITSVAVAAHECGHAIQHAHGYAPLNIRSSLVPVVNFASNMSWVFIMLGFFTRGIFLQIGILLFSASVLFQIVTLPV